MKKIAFAALLALAAVLMAGVEVYKNPSTDRITSKPPDYTVSQTWERGSARMSRPTHRIHRGHA